MKQTSLRPQDLAVALELALHPNLAFVPLAAATSLSTGEVHGAVERLRLARLLTPGERRVQRTSLLEFIVGGVPYAFPAELGSVTRGVPTAASGPPLAQEFSSVDPMVWPSADGGDRGESVTPLYPRAPELVKLNPELYKLLTLVDALRVGRARERQRAKELLTKQLGPEGSS
jgi:hypothetical protein